MSLWSPGSAGSTGRSGHPENPGILVALEALGKLEALENVESIDPRNVLATLEAIDNLGLGGWEVLRAFDNLGAKV